MDYVWIPKPSTGSTYNVATEGVGTIADPARQGLALAHPDGTLVSVDDPMYVALDDASIAALVAMAEIAGGGSTSVFVYNSGGAQTGNRFNDWPDLMDAVAAIDGPKIIQFEQDETIGTTGMPVGGWNLNGSTLQGQGVFGADGIIITFGNGVILDVTGIPSHMADEGLVLYSISNDPIVTVPDAKSFYFVDDVIVCCKTKEFFLVTATGTEQVLFSFRTGSGFCLPSFLSIAGGDYETVNITGNTTACYVVDTAGSSNLQDDTLRGTGGIVRVVMSSALPSGTPAGDVQTNLAGGWFVFLAESSSRTGFDDNGNTYVLGDHVQAALDATDAKLIDLEARLAALEP